MPFNFLCCVRPNVEDIVELDYCHQSLSEVPSEVFVYERTLETLLCHCNRITELPRQLFMCHGLKYLDLSDNEVQAIPQAISSLTNLQYLNINRNSLTSIPESMKSLKHLCLLDLSVNPLEKLPDAITNLSALQELYLNDTYLEYLPGNFGRLSNLKILELRDNYLMILPKSLSRSTELQRLDIGQNEFQEFPEVIGRFLKLKELWIDNNSLTLLPAFIKPLDNLIHLEASNNMIEELAPEIGYCSGLVDVCLSSNSLVQLPDSIGQLNNLTSLKLDNNRLYSLPESIGSLSNLEELMLMCNFLEKLPSSIGLLRKLQYLNLDENLLRSIPPEIGSCSKLSVLSLRSNKLTSIPPEVGHLTSLKVLNLVQNSLSFLPQSLLNCDNLVALWLSENQSKPLVPMHSEVNPQSYEQVLTCYLFPQVPLSPIESKLENETNIHENSTNSRHISFVDMKAAPKVPEKPGQLRRAPTPYPKELRALAKHARNIHKDNTQDVSPQMQNAVHIKAAKITPTLQQKYAMDNNMKDSSNIITDNPDGSQPNSMTMSVYDNIPETNYDKPLDFQYDKETYKVVDHQLYPENNEGVSEHKDLQYDAGSSETYIRNHDVGNLIKTDEIMPLYSQNISQDSFNRSAGNSLRSNNSEVTNRIQRFSLASQDRQSGKETIPENFEETSYSQIPLIDKRPKYDHIPMRNEPTSRYSIPEGNYHNSVYDSDTYAHAREKIYGQRNYGVYKYNMSNRRDLPSPRIHTVSQSVSSSTTMPNISTYSNIYPGVENHYSASLRTSAPNSVYGSTSSPTYVSTQSPELYSPTGHTNMTNPYRMTNTPLVCDDGSCRSVHSPNSQNIYDIYDSTPSCSNPPSVTGHPRSPSDASEPMYGRGQPPPYHIAAPFTKHAQYFNGTSG